MNISKLKNQELEHNLLILSETELKEIVGGGSLSRFYRWLGRKAGELFPCYCSTGIGYHNYHEYVNSNDPLM